MAKPLGKDIPKLCALILAGGDSSRMHTDKSRLDYHGQEHQDYTFGLTEQEGVPTYLSYRKDQEADKPPHLPKLVDRYEGMGPLAGLLTAFEYQPSCAWLLLPIDLPFIDPLTIRQLIRMRDPQADVSAMKHPEQDQPEPLIAIWEPSSYAVLKEAAYLGQHSLIRAMDHLRVCHIPAQNPHSLVNVNDPLGFKEAKRKIESS